MTETEARTLVQPVPQGSYGCEGCGIAAQGEVTGTIALGGHGAVPGGVLQHARCTDCAARHERARLIAVGHPDLGARVGFALLVERLDAVLAGLAVLGLQADAEEVVRLLGRLHAPARRARWSGHVGCVAEPWAHVTDETRAALRQAYADALRDRVAAGEAPVDLPCPSTACLFCGIGSVTMPAVEVRRRGGRDAAVGSRWRSLYVSPTALGGHGASMVSGHLCPACTEAVADCAGVVGQPARARAVVAHVRRRDARRAERLQRLLADAMPPSLPGWGAVTRPANLVPWSHVSRLLDAL